MSRSRILCEFGSRKEKCHSNSSARALSFIINVNEITSSERLAAGRYDLQSIEGCSCALLGVVNTARFLERIWFEILNINVQLSRATLFVLFGTVQSRTTQERCSHFKVNSGHFLQYYSFPRANTKMSEIFYVLQLVQLRT